jgi:hypothetical protein
VRNLQKFWQDVKFLICDEISMIGQHIFSKIHKNLMIAKDNNNFFGKIHCLFTGDFFQFPPVLDVPLYEKSEFENYLNNITNTLSSACTQNRINKNFGRYLWLQLTHCIILTEQIRQRNDINYYNLLKRLRYGNCTESDYESLMNKTISRNGHVSQNINSRIIFSRNKLRTLTNKKLAKKYAEVNNNIIFICKSKDTWHNKGKNLYRDAVINLTLNESDDSETERMATKLLLIEGCSYILTKNTCTDLGLTNGTEVKLHKICYSENINETDINNEKDISLKTLPSYLLVSKIKSKNESFDVNFTQLEKNIFPIQTLQRFFPFTY